MTDRLDQTQSGSDAACTALDKCFGANNDELKMLRTTSQKLHDGGSFGGKLGANYMEAVAGRLYSQGREMQNEFPALRKQLEELQGSYSDEEARKNKRVGAIGQGTTSYTGINQ